MPRVREIVEVENGPVIGYYFHCPGCNRLHQVNIKPNRCNGLGGTMPVWTFSGTLDRPTIRASVLVRLGMVGETQLCHSFVTDGRIEFLGDCTHALKGQTVELPEVD